MASSETPNQPPNTEGKKVTDDSSTLKPSKILVKYKFCDIQVELVSEWNKQFKEYIPDRVQVYKGDIFNKGPAADAIVSPAQSFGFMDGGIDLAYSKHFGWQMQNRLQEIIRRDHHGELLVGETIIMPTFKHMDTDVTVNWAKYNGGQPIKYLISAPTMRIPMNVNDTANAYLAFRAVILSVEKFNATPGNDPIRSVLCPGLGTAVGRMSAAKCVYQMLRAFETFEMGLNQETIHPPELSDIWMDHAKLIEYGQNKDEAREMILSKSKRKQVSSKIQSMASQLDKTNIQEDTADTENK